jgi:imidazole glycerol-phosphate synthase subunit HisH
MSVAIIDYGMGNVASVQKALNTLNLESVVTKDRTQIDSSKYIVLPGVGSFSQGISNLKKDGLFDFLTEQVIKKKKPFLGICLGMQLIATKGTEPFDTGGLNWVQGEVIKMAIKDKRIPHLGWNNIEPKNDRYFFDLSVRDFYFIHSYHFKVSDTSHISSTVNYGIEMVSSIQKENIFATQFHPEKSQEAGLKLLKNFFELNA